MLNKQATVANWQEMKSPVLVFRYYKIQSRYVKLQGEFIIHPDKKDFTPGLLPSFTILLLSTLIHIPSEHISPTDYNRPIPQ